MNHLALLSTPTTIGAIPLDDLPPMSPLTDLEEESDDMVIIDAPRLGPLPSTYIINTKYNPKSDINTVSKCPRTASSRDIYYATQRERRLAEKAKIATSLDDLKKKVCVCMCMFSSSD